MKECTGCKQTKDFSEFGKRNNRPCGYRSKCKECCKKAIDPIKNKKYHQDRYQSNKESYKQNSKNWYQNNKEAHREFMRAWYEENKEEYLNGRKEYYQDNKKAFRERDSKRRALEIQAIPSWADRQKLKEIYQNCPDGYEVDHIIPLNNKTVCGLHVPSNLQYLTVEENRKKGNKLNA